MPNCSAMQSYRGAGVSNYSRELLRALGELSNAGATPHDITAYVHARQPGLDGIEQGVTALPLERPAARMPGSRVRCPCISASGADPVHGLVGDAAAGRAPAPASSPCTTSPSCARRRSRRSSALSHGTLPGQRGAVPPVISVSRQTASDLQQYWATPAGRITVVHNGVSPCFHAAASGRIAALRRQNDLPERYPALPGHAGTAQISTCCCAYARWRRPVPPADSDVALVLAGAKGWYYDDLSCTVTALGLAGRVIFPGFVPPPTCRLVHAGAEALSTPASSKALACPCWRRWRAACR